MSLDDYPRELERDVALTDGTALHLRPIRPEDAPRLIDFYDRLSRHSAYRRFFSIMRRLPPDWARMLATVDYRRRLALVAERGSAGAPELVGVGGIHRFCAYVLADNARMLGLLTRFTDVRERRLEAGVVTLHFERRADEPAARHG